MKRAEKIALLEKIVQGEISEQTRSKLKEAQGRACIIAIIRNGSSGPTPEDMVTIREGMQKITMPYRDLEAYARRRGVPVMFIFPDNEL